jgi:hypothetical protein
MAPSKLASPRASIIKEKKMTLPLILHTSKVDAATRRRIIYIVKNQRTTGGK